MGYIVYKGENLAKNSHAYELFEKKMFKQLDEHLVQVNKEYQKNKKEKA